MPGGEFERIARLARRFAGETPGVVLGIGDDAAVLEVGGRRLVWTIDEHVEGTHFRRELVSWEDEGYRSFMAAASDLAAMGGEPWCALSALALPAALDLDAFEALTEGQRIAAEEVGAAVIGGNLVRSDRVSLTTTLLGTCERAIPRAGAVAGDVVWISGHVGLARAGLMALERGLAHPQLVRAVRAWRRPRARVAEGRAMALLAHAAIDISDGLVQDIEHVSRASGVSVLLDESLFMGHLRAGKVDVVAAVLGVDPLDLALSGGEDYAIIAVGPESIPGFSRIGVVREGEGVSMAGPSGERALAAGGFDHFAQGK